ncbi:MAG: OmpA family protein [Cyclobacteriaceae bacterium]|nr:OmpA family protein [Cyclobacteriaceae bacterium]
MTLSRWIITASLTLMLVAKTAAQQYYVVIGAFAIESNAKKFTGYARNQRYDAEYRLRTDRNLFYVYVLKTTSRKEAYAQTIRLQKETEFKDAWAFYGTLGDEKPLAEVKPEPEKKPAAVNPVIEPVEEPTVVIIEEVTPQPEPVVSTEPEPLKPKGKFFKFQITTTDGRLVPGEVHYVDRQQGRDIATYKTGELVDILKPSDERPMTVVCGIFGFKEVVKVIDYNDPGTTEGASQGSTGEWVISYQLERMKKGDVTVMYNVSFYKDAVVMLPKSKAELDELVNMMNLNPKYKIKIHGHCNGNYNKRKIIALGKSKNYFEMKGSDEKNGSSKELSKLRAEAIQSYLVEHGVDKKRTEVFAWGGTNMLVGENSASARLNDRIEIEILED